MNYDLNYERYYGDCYNSHEQTAEFVSHFYDG